MNLDRYLHSSLNCWYDSVDCSFVTLPDDCVVLVKKYFCPRHSRRSEHSHFSEDADRTLRLERNRFVEEVDVVPPAVELSPPPERRLEDSILKRLSDIVPPHFLYLRIQHEVGILPVDDVTV